LVGLDSSGQVVVRKRCSRTQLLAYTANVRVQVIGWKLAADPISSGEPCEFKVTMYV
jgi:hypothetical protein